VARRPRSRAPAALASAALALGAVAALLAALAGWGMLGPRTGHGLPSAEVAGDRRLGGALGFAALAAAVGFLYRLALALPSDAMATVELALLAVALAAWARRRAARRPALRAAMLAAMLLAAAAAVGLAARAAPESAAEPPAPGIAAGT
jgi:hypothetical protein